MSQLCQESQILCSVPFERGFHFVTEKKGYTGVTANSLPDFAAKLETIDIDSVLFHYPRGDFQKWIDDTLGDKELASKMCFAKADISGEDLRKQLLALIHKRINGLKKI
jgi:hypothetical protein